MFSIVLIILCSALCRNICHSIDTIRFSKNVTATRGEDVSLRCDALSDIRYVKRSWTKETSIIFANSKKYTTDGRWKLLTDDRNGYKIELKNVTVNDEGLYTCTLYGAGQSNELVLSNVFLTVEIPSSFSGVSDNPTVVDEGDNVVLHCKATGKPQPQVKWRHLIPSADGIRAKSEFLPLGKVERGSGGSYECIADNGVLLPIKHTIELVVKYPPELDEYKFISALKASLRSSATLECTASAVPDPVFTWHLPSGLRVTSATADRSYKVINLRQDNSVQSRLFLSTVSEFDYGNYTCTAANELGSVSKAIVLSRSYLPPTRLPPKLMFRRIYSSEPFDSDGSGGANSVTSHSLVHFFIYFSCAVHACLCLLFC